MPYYPGIFALAGASLTNFPTIVAVSAQSFFGSPNSQVHNVNMPAVVDAGDLLLVFVGGFSTGGITTPSGWTELYDSVFGTNNAAAFAKAAAGNEDGTQVNFNSIQPNSAVSQLYHIRNWDGSVANITVSTIAQNATATELDIPSVTNPGGVEKCLFIEAAYLIDDDVHITVSSPNYSVPISTLSGAGANQGCSLGTAHRFLEAASDDPGVMQFASQERAQAMLLVIPPA